jgi:hypothetical protein
MTRCVAQAALTAGRSVPKRFGRWVDPGDGLESGRVQETFCKLGTEGGAHRHFRPTPEEKKLCLNLESTSIPSLLICVAGHLTDKVLVMVVLTAGSFVSVLSVIRGGAVVEALRYKPEGCGIYSRSFHWKFSLT